MMRLKSSHRHVEIWIHRRLLTNHMCLNLLYFDTMKCNSLRILKTHNTHRPIDVFSFPLSLTSITSNAILCNWKGFLRLTTLIILTYLLTNPIHCNSEGFLRLRTLTDSFLLSLRSLIHNQHTYCHFHSHDSQHSQAHWCIFFSTKFNKYHKLWNTL